MRRVSQTRPTCYTNAMVFPARWVWQFCLLIVASLATPLAVAAEPGSGNTIRKYDFNFAHQLGYLYARMDDAYFGARGDWSFETGALGYYTHRMPLVQNPDWQRRLFLQVPGGLRVSPSNNIELIVNSDLVAEFPYRDRHSVGGNSPRFQTKMRLLEETEARPAVAFTVGVKFSSAKPYNIWDNNHNYWDSNGMAGTGTGVADYWLLFHSSKRMGSNVVTGRLGLAPVGDPTAYTRGSSQADQILYGVSWRRIFNEQWSGVLEVAGMWGAISTTRLDHYSVLRSQLARRFGSRTVVLNLERGLTWTSNDWVAGVYTVFEFGKTRYFFRPVAAGF
jgi:hypothetical protein